MSMVVTHPVLSKRNCKILLSTSEIHDVHDYGVDFNRPFLLGFLFKTRFKAKMSIAKTDYTDTSTTLILVNNKS